MRNRNIRPTFHRVYMRNSFLKFMSRRWVSWLFLILGILTKTVLIFYYSYVGRDKMYHLSASNNLLNGKGWTNSFYPVENIYNEVLLPFCHWPPGYGLLMTPLHYVFREDVFLSTTLFEISFFLLFLFLSRAILKLLDIPLSLRNVFTILIAFFSYDFIEDSLGTDLPSLCFLLGFVFFIIKLWLPNDATKNYLIKYGIAAGICLFMAGFIRYTYVPLGLAFPLILVLIAYWIKCKKVMPGLLACTLVCISGLVLMMVFLQTTCGAPLKMVAAESGFFPSNLFYWHPAIIASVVNVRVAPTILERVFGVSYSSWQYFFSYINMILYAIFLFIAAQQFYRTAKTPITANSLFKIIGAILSILIVLELAYLSLTNGLKHSVNGNVWTYIVEGRYHAFVIVFIQIILFVEYARMIMGATTRRLKKIILHVLMVLFILTCLHQMYFAIKVATKYKTYKSSELREADYVWFLSKIHSHSSGPPLLVASTDAYYPLIASINFHKGLLDPLTLNDEIPDVKHYMILITIIQDNELPVFEKYLSHKDVRLLKRIGSTNFFTQELQP